MAVLLTSIAAVGQDTFNPTNPDEPSTPPPNLVLRVQPEGAGSVSGGGKYAAGTTVSLRASGNTGFVFVNWTDASGNVVSTDQSFSYTKKETDEILTANFTFSPASPTEPSEPQLTPRHLLKLVASGPGSVSGGGRYEEGTSVRISASAETGCNFINWTYESGEVVSTDSYISYTIGSTDTTLVAHFEFNPSSPGEPSEPDLKPKHNITVTAGDGGTVSASSTRAQEGTVVTLRASANTGYTFVGWYSDGELIATTSTYEYTVGTSDASFEAVFAYTPSSPNEPGEPSVSKHSFYLMTVPAKQGDVVECQLYLNTVSEIGDMTFQLTFPEGVTANMAAIKLSAAADGYTENVTTVNDSTFVITLTGGTLPAGTIKLMSVNLLVPDDYDLGRYGIYINQVQITQADGTTITASTRNGRLEVYMRGDTNGNGVIDLQDLVMTRDHIHGALVDGFVPIVADVNNDGIVDEADVEQLKQMILNK